MSLVLALSPGGHLLTEPDEQAEPKLSAAAVGRLTEAFAESAAQGLELLASAFLHEPLPPSFGFWRGLARRYFTALCHAPNTDTPGELSITAPGESEWLAWSETAPPMKGLDYLNSSELARLWNELDTYIRSQIARTAGGVGEYLKSCHPTWNTVGRVTFHLAENKRNPAFPFAFLATYTHQLSEQGRAQHLPLGRALEEYAGAKNRVVLAALLSPVQRAAEQSKFARELLDSRAVFHPQVWRPDQAFAFLQSIPLFEQSGLVVRIPDWWKAGHPPRPQVTVRLGETVGTRLGEEGLLDFRMHLSLEGEPLSDEELRAILQSTDGLTLLKGKWVEVDGTKLKQVLEHWKAVQSDAGPGGLPLLEGLRLLAGFSSGGITVPETESARTAWSVVTAGEALKKLLNEMQQPQASTESDPGPELRAQLRPYQRQGAHWLWFMNKLGFGACLADDMGLGKTMQVLSLLLWKSIQRECAGKIDSLIELLQGKLSSAVMQIVTRPDRGLFPAPKEIELDCSCPDWADLCKHVAASLYGVGARLDQSPELLFLLRGVDPSDLISKASAAEAVRQTAPVGAAHSLAEQDLAEVFGIELATVAPSVQQAPAAAALREEFTPVASSEPSQRPQLRPPRKVARKFKSRGQSQERRISPGQMDESQKSNGRWGDRTEIKHLAEDQNCSGDESPMGQDSAPLKRAENLPERPARWRAGCATRA